MDEITRTNYPLGSFVFSAPKRTCYDKLSSDKFLTDDQQKKVTATCKKSIVWRLT